MSVIIEAISVVIRQDTLAEKYPGGIRAYIDNAPNSTICCDGYLARIGFMDPADARAFIATLETHGMQFLQDNKAVDIAIVDQLRGPTAPVFWLECANLTSGEISIIVAFDKRDKETGNVAMPLGWTYENSLSKNMTFVPTDELDDRMELLDEEDGIEVYRDRQTGKIHHVGRPRIKPE